LKNSNRVPKNAEFYADFRSAGKRTKNAREKSFAQNSQLKMNFLGFYLYIVLVFIHTFFGVLIFAFCTQHEILRFLLPILIFFKSFFGTYYYFMETLEQNAHPMQQNMEKSFLLNRS